MAVELELEGTQEVKAPTLASMLETPEPEETEGAGAETGLENEGANAATAAQALLDQAAETERLAAEALALSQKEGAAPDEISELRSMLRSMKQENLQMKIQLEKVLAVQTAEIGSEPAPGVLEALQTELNTVAERRGESFSTLLEAMELNPKFEDVREVCSGRNFNDMFESVARIRSEENGSSLDEELMKAKLEVWKLPNPYKYMYEAIKEYHPTYKGKAEAVKTPEVPAKPAQTAKEVLAAAAEASKRTPKPADAPGSIAGLAGSATDQGGWTAAKIDSLDETELRKVPREVYNKWLTGELD